MASAQEAPHFEVASIKPTAEGILAIPGACHGIDIAAKEVADVPLGRCRYIAYTLKMFIADAFPMTYPYLDSEISGGPGWTDTDRFTIEAKADDPERASFQDLTRMLQTLLIERFQLKFHVLSREANGYRLTVAKGGPKLTATRGGSPQLIPVGIDTLTVVNEDMDAFTTLVLEGHLKAPVENATGLAGKYDFKLRFLPGQNDPDRLPDSVYKGLGVSLDTPSLFEALHDQLGLQLEKAPKSVTRHHLVIDSAVRPTPN